MGWGERASETDHVEGEEENGEDESDDDKDELGPRRVFIFTRLARLLYSLFTVQLGLSANRAGVGNIFLEGVVVTGEG